ncbi:MAG TPA: helix-turn-helix domain-containing protein, partial [Demequina sp.]|nr:helix-turn-helix domain-containing protein [Demequina sp.]
MSPRDPQQVERRHVPPTVARQSSLRDQNLSVVTRTLFASGGATSRAGLAERTGLTRATVSRLCQELLDAGILAEQRPAENVRPGRPGTPLAPASRTLAGVGIEVNIDYMAGRALDLAGNVLAEFKKPGTYADSDPAAVLPELGDLAVGLVEQVRATGARIVGTTLALPGLVESTTNTLLLAPNLNWRMVEPVPLLGSRWSPRRRDPLARAPRPGLDVPRHRDHRRRTRLLPRINRRGAAGPRPRGLRSCGV